MLLGRRGELLLSRLAPSNPSDFQMANLGPRCQFVLSKEVLVLTFPAPFASPSNPKLNSQWVKPP